MRAEFLQERRESPGYVPDNGEPLPPQPTSIGPVADPIKAKEPLSQFSRLQHDLVYGHPSSLDSEDIVPVRPSDWVDPYLYPVLAHNEQTRLSLFWYHTNGLADDKETLKRMDRILDLVKQSIGWDIGIIGLLDATTYTRLVTANMSLAILPRRESTCSHVVNQEPGTVLTIQDMSQDWRFKQSPAAINGLRSYAGAQLRLALPGGDQVVFGSICLASMTVQKPMTDEQKKTLTRAGDLIMSELLTRTRMLRLRERQSMSHALIELQERCKSSTPDLAAIQTLQDHYPGSQAFLTQNESGFVEITNSDPIPLTDFKDGIWENMPNIMSKALGDERSTCGDSSLRALVGKIAADSRHLVIVTANLGCVFDDLDVWFIEQCGQILGSALQSKALEAALAAKDMVLRSITHELRTPIHGILSCVELLNTELDRCEILYPAISPDLPNSKTMVPSLLKTIQHSGIELMTTVNNLLRLNSSFNSVRVIDYDLCSLEADVLGEVFAHYSEGQLHGLAIVFENKFAKTHCLIRVDADLLKELLKCLIFNAITATAAGMVKVLFQLEDSSMVFDVIDSGAGIAEIDHERIFQSFEKVKSTSKGTGIGLKLARQMASSLGGVVRLISSEPGRGSHFQIQIPYQPSPMAPARGHWTPYNHEEHSPKTYYVSQNSSRDLHLLSRLEIYLTQRGLLKSDNPDRALIITNRPDPMCQYGVRSSRFSTAPHLVFVVSSSAITEADRACVREEVNPHFGFPLSGPLYTSRLDEILTEATELFNAYCQSAGPAEASQLAIRTASVVTRPVQPQKTEATPRTMPEGKTDEPMLAVPSARILRALLVDDNFVNLKVLQMFCQKSKIPFDSAVDGKKAFSNFSEKAHIEPFSLVLMDLQMPECDGVDACKHIRRYEKEQNLRPSIIFMITGQDSVADRKNSFDAGVNDFFVKPVSLKKLGQAIVQYFPHPEGSAT